MSIDRQALVARDKTALVGDVAVLPPDDADGYEAALWAAGVKVLAYETFGSYQGEWLAHIELPNGERLFIADYYGSCSGCDAFQADFGYDDWRRETSGLHKLQAFGRRYLENCLTFDEALAEASRNIEWDSDAQAMVDWLNTRRNQHG